MITLNNNTKSPKRKDISNEEQSLRRFIYRKLLSENSHKIGVHKLLKFKTSVMIEKYILFFNSIPQSDLSAWKIDIEYKRNKKDTSLKYEFYKKKAVLSDDTGLIYLIGNLESKYVKIGFSKNPKERIKELQTGCPFKLSVIATFQGNLFTEKALHLKYNKYNSYGEWFKIEGELKNNIENLIL